MATNLMIDYKNSKRIHIGTRWFQEDMINYIKEHEKGYARFKMTAYDEKNNEPIYPERFDNEVLEAKKEEMGTYMFATQMLLNPTPIEKMVFKPHWIRYYENAPETKNILAIDPAIGENKRNCDSAFIVGGGADNGLIYILEAYSGHPNLTEQVKLAFALIRKYNIHRVVIETIAYQEALAQAIEIERDRVDDQNIKINEDVHFSVIREVPGSRDTKDARIQSMIPYFEYGKVITKKNMKKLEKQLREYPYGQKRDLIDVLAYILRNIGYKKIFKKKAIPHRFSLEAVLSEIRGRKRKSKYVFQKARMASMSRGNNSF